MPPLSTFAPVNSAPGGLLRSWSWTRRRVTGPESLSSMTSSCGPPTLPPAFFRHAGAGSAEADRNDPHQPTRFFLRTGQWHNDLAARCIPYHRLCDMNRHLCG